MLACVLSLKILDVFCQDQSNTFNNVSVDVKSLHLFSMHFPFSETVVVDHFSKECWVILFPIRLNLVSGSEKSERLIAVALVLKNNEIKRMEKLLTCVQFLQYCLKVNYNHLVKNVSCCHDSQE